MAEHFCPQCGELHGGEPEPEPVVVVPDEVPESDAAEVAAIEAMEAVSVAAIEAVRDVAETEAITDMVSDLAEEETEEHAGEPESEPDEDEEEADDEGAEEEAPPAQQVAVPPQLKDDAKPAPKRTQQVSRFRAHRQ